MVSQVHLGQGSRTQWTDAVRLEVKDLLVSLHAVVQVGLRLELEQTHLADKVSVSG